VILQGRHFEVTTLRTDAGYHDGRRPSRVDFVASIEDDLARRDFTVNAIAFDPESEALIDPHAGLVDLGAGLLRAVGEPSQRFAEDGLRVLRAARFVASLQLTLDPATASAIRPSLASYHQVSAERIREEWNKTLAADEPSRGFVVMQEHGLLDATAPELSRLHGEPALGGSLLAHCLRRVDRTPRQPASELRLAALLENLEDTLPGSTRRADALLLRLRYSNAERRSVCALVAASDLPTSVTDGAGLRRWLHRIGAVSHRDLCALGRADLQARAQATGASPTAEQVAEERRLDDFERAVDDELSRDPPLSLAQLAIDGQTLMHGAGIERGPKIGQTLRRLLDEVLTDPALNTEDQLLERAKGLSRDTP
jgi:tRNA nucleotidyltransferase (CCA-adding enzyme)